MQAAVREAEDDCQTKKRMLLIMRCKLQKQDTSMCLFSQNATQRVAQTGKQWLLYDLLRNFQMACLMLFYHQTRTQDCF